MKSNRELCWAVIGAIVVFGSSSSSYGAVSIPVTDWVVHTGGGIVSSGAATNTPTFTGADNNTVMGHFPSQQLYKTGDSIKLTTTLALGTRTGGVGVATLNTQLRIGLFDGPGVAVGVGDAPNTGYIIEYTNNTPATKHLIRRQDSLTNAPFVSPTDIGNGTDDVGGQSIQGQDIGPVIFELMLTRNGNLIDVSGKIEGTDSTSGLQYLSTYSLASQAIPPSGFVFDRVGFFFGGNVNAPDGTLNNVTITAVIPEPGSILVFAVVTAMGGAGWWQAQNSARRRTPTV